MIRRHLIVGMAALVAALTLAGCGASWAPAPPSPATVTETFEPTDLAGTTPSPTVPPPVKTEECHLWEFAPADDPEAVVGWKQQIPVDSGTREHADGDVTLSDSGVPVAYVVAADDWPIAIGERFCMNLAYLNVLNGVRRQGALELWAGDTINLDAHTILTVGDQDGVVYDNSPSSPIPPQR